MKARRSAACGCTIGSAVPPKGAPAFRALVGAIHFGEGRPLTLVAHDIGAPPALIWAADHPDEIATLLYIEAPVMIFELLSKMIAYTPEAMRRGSMWWWILPLAPGVPDAHHRQRTRDTMSLVAQTVQSVLDADAGHFLPEERPDEVVRHTIAAAAARAAA